MFKIKAHSTTFRQNVVKKKLGAEGTKAQPDSPRYPGLLKKEEVKRVGFIVLLFVNFKTNMGQ